MLFEVDSTLGAMMIGVVVAGGLWGVSTAQAYHYYTVFPRDHIYLKSVVALLWSLETSHQALIGHALYTFVITNFANPLAIVQTSQWTIIIQTLVAGLVGLIVQLFFTWRIWRLSNRNYLYAAVIAAMAVAQFVIICIFTAQFLESPNLIQIQLTTLPTLMPIMAGLSVATDFLIAFAMCYLLNRNRSQSGRTGRLIDVLVGYTLSTGVLTSLFAVAHLAMYMVYPASFWYMASFFVASRLHFNSLLASLNLRTGTAAHQALASGNQEQSKPHPYVSSDLEVKSPVIIIRPGQEGIEYKYPPSTGLSGRAMERGHQ